MKTILCSFIFLSISVCLTAQPGTLDSSFNKDGKVISKTYTGECFTSLIQPDGKIVVGGSGSYYKGNNLLGGSLLARYNIDGSLDYSFADSGRGVYILGDTSAYIPVIHAMVLQKDGKILALGAFAQLNGEFGFALMRFSTDGSADKSFGINGMTLSNFTGLDFPKDLAVLSNGKIVVTGYAYNAPNENEKCFLSCYNIDGSLDKNFGDSGVTIIDLGFNLRINAIAVTTGNKIIIGGIDDTYFKNILLRYDDNGIIDSSFGINGLAKMYFAKNIADGTINDITINTDGTIITAGWIELNSGTIAISVSRFAQNGKPDSSFGTNGYTYIQKSIGNSYGTSVAIQRNGKIIIGGYHSVSDTVSFMVVRYNAEGSLDSAFGVNGIQNTFILGSDLAYSVNLQRDGKIVMAGYSLIYYGSNYRYSVELVRYNGDSTKRQIIINKIKHYISTHNNADATTLNNSINLYPNPANNIVTINNLDAKTNYGLSIINNKGNVVATKQVSNLSFYQFNLQNVSSGVYYVNVVANNKLITTLKFVKQ
ncbi:MAG: T9SS type A sorting domain-containing protein [Parafilimonas sp.]